MKKKVRKSNQTTDLLSLRKKVKALEAAKQALRKEREDIQIHLEGRTLELRQANEYLGGEITHRMMADQRIIHLNRFYGLLINISHAILRIRNREELFDEICRIAVEDGGFPIAWISLVDNVALSARVVARCGEDHDFPQISLEGIAEGRGPTGTAIRTMKRFVCNDLEAEEQILASEVWGQALKRGYRSVAVFPLVVYGSMRGVFNLCAEEVDFFDEHEITLLENMILDVSHAIETMEREEQLGRWQIALYESERQMSAIYSNVSDAMFYLAVEPIDRYRIISVNNQLLHGFSLTTPEIVDRYVEDVMKESEYASVLEHYHKAIREKQTVRWEKTFILAAGKKNVEISVTPILDGKGNCTNLVGIVHDITERRRTEHALKDSRGKLATSSKLRTPFPLLLNLGRRLFSRPMAKKTKSTGLEEKKNSMGRDD